MFAKNKSVTIKKVDGGWIFEWSDPSADDDYDSYQSWPRRARPETSGTEIFTDAKKLMKRVADFIS